MCWYCRSALLCEKGRVSFSSLVISRELIAIAQRNLRYYVEAVSLHTGSLAFWPFPLFVWSSLLYGNVFAGYDISALLHFCWPSNSFSAHIGVCTFMDKHTHTHARAGWSHISLRHGDVEAIPKVIEFLTFVTTTSVFDKTLLHYSAACVWLCVGGCFSFVFSPTLVCVFKRDECTVLRRKMWLTCDFTV